MLQPLAIALGLTAAIEVGDGSTKLPYRPWQPGEPLPEASAPATPPSKPTLPGPSYARRPLQAYVAALSLPLECPKGEAHCTSHAMLGGIGWRPFPHFAWTFGFELTRTGVQSVRYFAAGARVFGFGSGPWDPYVELSLGGEHWSGVPGINLAGEIVFGLGVAVSEHLRLGPLLKLRNGAPRLSTCYWYREACPARSLVGERWFATGLLLEVLLGPPH